MARSYLLVLTLVLSAATLDIAHGKYFSVYLLLFAAADIITLTNDVIHMNKKHCASLANQCAHDTCTNTFF